MADVNGGLAGLRLVLGAHSAEDYTGVSGAILDVDDAFMARVMALAEVCKLHNLVRVAAYGGPADWLPLGVEDEYRLNLAVMEVSSDGMWFEDQPKNGDSPVQTRWIGLDELARLRSEHAGSTINYENKVVRVLATNLLPHEEIAGALEGADDDDEAESRGAAAAEAAAEQGERA